MLISDNWIFNELCLFNLVIFWKWCSFIVNAYLIDAISNTYLRNAINTNQLNQNLLNLKDYIVFILFQVYSTIYFIWNNPIGITEQKRLN